MTVTDWESEAHARTVFWTNKLVDAEARMGEMEAAIRQALIKPRDVRHVVRVLNDALNGKGTK